jgi:hypothetical protein
LTGNQTLLARAAIGIAAGAATLAIVSNHRLRAVSPKQFDRMLTTVFAASRIVFFVGIFIILHIAPRGDIPVLYWDQAVQVLHGMLPYRDFISSYAPLHPYLDAAVLGLWYSPLAIILFSILIECLLIPLWLRLSRTLFAEQDIRTAALLYLTSAVSLQFVTVDGHDDVLLGMLMALSILWLRKDRNVLSGTVIGLGATLTKFLPLIYAPIFFLTATRRWRWTAGLLLPVVIVYGVFVMKHLDILSVLANEGNLRSANNITFLVEGILGITIPSIVWNGLMAIALLLIFALVAHAISHAQAELRLHPVIFGTVAITITIELLAKKSWPPYLLMALFPICLLISASSKLKTTLFAMFNIIAVVSPSYWATATSQATAEEFHRGLLTGQLNAYILLFLQIALVAGYAWLLKSSLQRIATPHQTAE